MNRFDTRIAFESPISQLQEQLNDGVLQPYTQVPDDLLGELQGQIPYDEDRWIRPGTVDVWKPNSTRLVQETFAALYRVSMTGFEDIADEDHAQLSTGYTTTTLGLHIDDGYTHVVNLTIHGEREVTVRDPLRNAEETITARPGTISVVRSRLNGGSLTTLPHSVHAEHHGSALQHKAGFQHRSLRLNLPA